MSSSRRDASGRESSASNIDEEETHEWLLTSHNPRYEVLKQLYAFRKSQNTNASSTDKDAKCSFCGKEILVMRLSRLLDHSFKCRASDAELVEELRAAHEEYKNRSRTSSALSKTSQELHTFLDELNVDFISDASLPLSTTDNPYYRKIFATLQPSYKMASRRKLTSYLLPKRALFCKQEAKEKLGQSPNYSLTLEFDGWVSSSGFSLLAFVITTWTGFSVLIGLIDVTTVKKDANLLAQKALNSISQSGIRLNKFNCVVSDEASNCKRARAIISETHKHLVQYRCIAHLCNLIGSSFSQSLAMSETLKRLAETIRDIRSNKVLMGVLKDENEGRPRAAALTRWYTTSASIRSMLKLKPFLLEKLQEDRFNREKWKATVLDTGFWRNLEDCKIYFYKLSAIIAYCERSNSKLNVALRELLEFGRFLFNLSNSSPFKYQVMYAFLLHFHRMDLDLMLTAYLLDPNQKCSYLTGRAIDKAKIFIVESLLNMKHPEQSARVALSELSCYYRLSKEEGEPVDNINSWWDNTHLSVLKLVGLRLASSHASSACTERVFSALNRIVTPERNRLDLDTLYNLIAVKIRNSNNEERKYTPRGAIVSAELTGEELEELDSDDEDIAEYGKEDDLLEGLSVEESQGGQDMTLGRLESTPEWLDFNSLINFNSFPLSSLVEDNVEQDNSDRGSTRSRALAIFQRHQ